MTIRKFNTDHYYQKYYERPVVRSNVSASYRSYISQDIYDAVQQPSPVLGASSKPVRVRKLTSMDYFPLTFVRIFQFHPANL